MFLYVSQSPVRACGTTFYRDYDGRDCHLTLSNNLLKHTRLATEVHSDSVEFKYAIQKLLCMYVYKLTMLVMVGQEQMHSP